MRIWPAVILGLLSPVPGTAQELDTSQLEQSADYERNRILVRSTMRQKEASDARRRGVTREQRQACANQPRFRAQHGANDPRVRLLARKCRAAGL